MPKRKLMVCGSRSITDKDWVFKQIQSYSKDFEPIIIEGGAKGIDTLAKAYAVENNLEIKEFPAEWDKYGRAAGPIRNKQMVEECDDCLILWNGSSRGTKNDIDLCKKFGKPHLIVIYE